MKKVIELIVWYLTNQKVVSDLMLQGYSKKDAKKIKKQYDEEVKKISKCLR